MVKNNFAFSLIEIIVVTAITAVVTSMGFANFHRQQSDQQLKAETRKMADMIALARKKASVGDASPCATGLYTKDKISQYNVEITLPNKYEIFPECIGTPSGNPNPEIITYTINTSDIRIIKPNPVSPLVFYQNSQKAIAPVLIEIKNDVTDRCCQIDINAAGVIKEIPCAVCRP